MCELHLQECKRRWEKRARDLYHSAHRIAQPYLRTVPSVLDREECQWHYATFDGRPAAFDHSGEHGHKTRINGETGLTWTFSGTNWVGLVPVFTRTFDVAKRI